MLFMCDLYILHITPCHRVITIWERKKKGKTFQEFTSELIAGGGFSMLSKGLPDLAQAPETPLLAPY
jgi:hypothetical protein